MPSLSARVAAETLRLLPRKRLSRSLGRLASRPTAAAVMKRAIGLYVRAYDVDLSEAEVPAAGFRTFDEFFTRPIRDGLRPIDQEPGALVSPADGRVEALGEVSPGATVRVKGTDYRVGALLGDAEAEDRFAGGWFTVIYLSPRDYHRVHAPVAGDVHTVRHVGGTLLPVNPFGVASYPRLFARNERVAVFQRVSEKAEIATIMVGAIGVGRISVSFDDSVMTNVGRGPTTVEYEDRTAPSLDRGAELGRFHLGSTVILVAGPGMALQPEVRNGDVVRVGQRLAVCAR